MYIFFFDLDNTLFPTDSSKFLHNLTSARLPTVGHMEALYNRNIGYDHKLRKLLHKIKYPKFIITNASRLHCLLILKNLGIMEYFGGGIDADHLRRQNLKPNPHPFMLAKNAFKIEKHNKCIFFDDVSVNLIIPKRMGWITVLISKKRNKLPYIDFWFPNIYKALSYFNNKI
jgi:HAD superfamily hydrolase (TIGR01509 family)